MRIALQALRRRPGRSAATAIGIGLATGLVVLLLALSSGIQGSATRLAAASGIDLVVTSANTTLTSSAFPPIDGAHGLPNAFHQADPNVASASPWLVGSLTFANASLFDASNRSANGTGVPSGWAPTGAASVGWIPGENSNLEVPGLYAGPGFSSSTDLHYAGASYAGPFSHEVELDQGLALLLHVGPGDLIWTSPRTVAGPNDLAGWFGNATAFRVVGVTAPFWLLPSEPLSFFFLSELQSVSGAAGPADPATLVLVHLADPTDPSADQARLAGAFPNLSVFTIGNILSAIQSAVDLYRTFGSLVGILGVVVATLFAGTVLWMSVDDRSREIAVFRAIGFPRRSVGWQVVEEGLWLSAFGLGIGLAIGYVGAYALNGFLGSLLPGLPSGFSFVSFDLGVVGLGVLEVVVVGALAALGPALRAMGLPIAEELRAP